MRKAHLLQLSLIGLAWFVRASTHATEPPATEAAVPHHRPRVDGADCPWRAMPTAISSFMTRTIGSSSFPKARMQIDAYTFLNPGSLPPGIVDNGPKDTRPKSTLFLRRARLEIIGTIARHFDYMLGGEFASTPATGTYGTVGDAFIIANFTQYAQFQVGQFDAPFTLENRTSDEYFDFMERSLAVRAFGIPSNKEDGLMAFGWLPRHFAYYSVGVFNGDGMNFKNQDLNPAVMGRGLLHRQRRGRDATAGWRTSGWALRSGTSNRPTSAAR